ncbi:unnamed protein product, partial [Staurois parvus]
VCIYTLDCQKYRDTLQIIRFRCFNHLNGHRCMQTASTNICERMGHSQELSEFRRCHLCLLLRSIHEISLLLNTLWSTVSGNITKWKQLGTTATQPRSGRPHKMTEWGQHMLKHTVHRDCQLSAESTAKDLQTLCGPQISTTTVRRELHGMGFHGRATASKPSITNCNAKRQMQWCKARCYWTLEQLRCFLWSDQSRLCVAIQWMCLGLVIARRIVLA